MQGSHLLQIACATGRHQVWHKRDRQAYGAVLTQSGNNHKLGIAGWQQCVGWCEQSASMCVCFFILHVCVCQRDRKTQYLKEADVVEYIDMYS